MNAEQSKNIFKELNTKRAFDFIVVGALFLLFFSELILREASTASLKKRREEDLESVISVLPSFLRLRVKERLELLHLKDAVKRAKTDKEKILALSSLATFLKAEKEKEKLYEQIMEFPRMPESYSAMIYFLERDNSNRKVTIKEYHEYIYSAPTENQYSLWSLGLSELKSKNKPREVLLSYLEPLLKQTPEFYDYRNLYKAIYEIATRLELKDKAKQADELSELCEELPTLYEYFEKKEREKM